MEDDRRCEVGVCDFVILDDVAEKWEVEGLHYSCLDVVLALLLQTLKNPSTSWASRRL